MPLDFDRVRELFGEFDFTRLFIEELGWSNANFPAKTLTVDDETFTAKPIAQLSGVIVFEVMSKSGDIPDARTKKAVHKEIAKSHFLNLLIFVDSGRVRSEWFWVKREEKKELPRPHAFVRGQQGDLFLGKVAPLLFEIEDFEKGDPSVVEVAKRLRLGLDVEKVTKKFYKEFQEQHLQFIEHITGIDDDRQRRWYASVLLNRLMFTWFLQRKQFVDDGNISYLQNKLEESKMRGRNLFFRDFLKLLFFEGFAKPEEDRSEAAKARLGNIRYLNGGLFLPHAIEQANPAIDVSDKAFDNLFSLFQRYTWNLNDTPGTESDEINPDVLGYIFEKYINQKAFGAYYTRPEITTYLCERTIHRLLLDAVNTPEEAKKANLPGKNYEFKTIGDLLLGLDNFLCRKLLFEVLPKLSILDPACGSGAFLVAAMKTLMNVYGAVTGYARLNGDAHLKRQMREIEKDHPSINYYIKKSIITNNLYGVDIMEEAVEIARLRLFLALVSSAHSVDDLEPLPNIDFNLLAGNSAIGLLRVDEQKFDDQSAIFRQRGQHILSVGRSFREIVAEKDRDVRSYRDASSYATDLRALRDRIETLRENAHESLNDILLQQFRDLGVKYDQATWDDQKQREAKGIKRPLTIDDIRDLDPFHWGYEFDEIVNTRRGFDAIITNPPWESVEPSAKTFFSEHSALVSKNKMDIKDFEKELKKLLRDNEVRGSWLGYLSRYNHQREYFRSAPEYENQIPVIDGRRQGKDINFYKLFLERCHRLLRNGGECGIVIPGGIYSDLGAKRLRELLFETTEVTGLFGFENRKQVFENVHRSFKFVVLTFRKGGATLEFPAAFMRHDAHELSQFPNDESLPVSVELVRRLSPDSLSISEFQSAHDVAIAEKMIRFPLLGEEVPGTWSAELHREFNMTDDAYLFYKVPGAARLPLYEGKMIWQFDAFYSDARFFLDEKAARNALLRKSPDTDQQLEYQRYRLAYRDVAANTNERTMVATVLPPKVFAGHTLHLCSTLEAAPLLYLTAIVNSFVFDWLLRHKVGAHCSIFYVYQMPVPRLMRGDPVFDQIVARSARLICTRPEFDDLAREVGVAPDEGSSCQEQRARIRAEVDAIVAHLYGLTETDLRHMLDGFPIVHADVKANVLETFRAWEPASHDPLLRLMAGGESGRLEFKETARWDIRQSQATKTVEFLPVRAVASFMNSEGGTLLIGVAADGSISGLDRDYKLLGNNQNADGFENYLLGRILEYMGRDRSRLLSVSFHTIEGKTLCRVDVQPSGRPVFVKDPQGLEQFFIRAGNSTRALSTSESINYCNEHFLNRTDPTPAAVAIEGSSTEPSVVRDAGDKFPKAGEPAPTPLRSQTRLPVLPPRKTATFPTHGLFGGKEPKATPDATKADPGPDDDESDPAPRIPITEQYDVADVLLLVRDVVTSSDPMPRDEVISRIATSLGEERVGSRILDLIESTLTTASRRFIIESISGGLVLCTRSIEDYNRDFLKTALKNVIGRTWTDETTAIRSATRWLGFRRTGSKIEQAFRSAIRGALRQGMFERDGDRIRTK